MLEEADDLIGETVTVRQCHLQAEVLKLNGEGFRSSGHLKQSLLQMPEATVGQV